MLARGESSRHVPLLVDGPHPFGHHRRGVGIDAQARADLLPVLDGGAETRVAEAVTRQEAEVKLVAVLEVLDDEEDGGADDRDDEVERRQIALADLRAPHRERGGEAAEEKDEVFVAPMILFRKWCASSKISGSRPRQMAYAQKRPPNMRISVAMKTHIPSFDALNCCAGVSK